MSARSMKMRAAAIALVWGTGLWSAEAYRVVLASFPTFEEAKSKMEKLGERLNANDRSLQQQIDYQIVARPSGKSYIIGIEPIGSKAEQEKVLAAFRAYYRDAYGDKYHGPTEGAVALGGAKPAPQETQAAVQHPDPRSMDVADVSEAVVEPIASEEDAASGLGHEANKTLEQVPEADSAKVPSEEPTYYGLFEGRKEWAWALAAITLLFIASVVWIQSLQWDTPHDDDDASEHDEGAADHSHGVEVPDTAQEELFGLEEGLLAGEPEKENTEDDHEGEDTDSEEKSGEEDIFHRLKKNQFFRTILEQLKEAADANEAHRCADLMEEVRRYQKSFRASPIIDRMEELVNNREMAPLAALIVDETA